MRTINLKREKPDLDTARKRLIAELEAARKQEQRVIKIIHGWGSSGKGGSLQVGIRKSLRLRMKEGKVRCFLPGERFSQDTNEGRELLKRHPQLRRDIDVNRANPGITIVEMRD